VRSCQCDAFLRSTDISRCQHGVSCSPLVSHVCNQSEQVPSSRTEHKGLCADDDATRSYLSCCDGTATPLYIRNHSLANSSYHAASPATRICQSGRSPQRTRSRQAEEHILEADNPRSKALIADTKPPKTPPMPTRMRKRPPRARSH